MSSFLLNYLGVLTALVAVVYVYFKWSYQYWKRRNVPYLEPVVPLGNLDNPLRRNFRESIAIIYKKAKARGWKYCGVYFMLSPSLLILDLELAKNILAKDFQYFMDRGAYANEKDDPIGCHLFALSGSKWRNLRTKLTPTFTSGKLKAMFQTLVDCGLSMEEYIDDKIRPEEPVDIKEIMTCFSTDVIGSCAFGIDCNSFKEPDSSFRRFGRKFLTIGASRAVKTLFCQNFPQLAKSWGLREVPADTAEFFTKVVEDTVSYREKNNVVRKDFLQLLMEIRNHMDGPDNKHNGGSDSLTLNEMAAQCFLFFVAGFETSATTMTFALFEMATHQDIQDRVRDEIKTVLASHEGKVTYDSVNEIKYLGQVIDETLRLHSPARILRRLCVKDYKAPGENLVIEKGTQVYFSVKGIHNDEDYWPNPAKFDPERFSEEKKKNMNQYAHMPFGQGPRMCIGERFGLMQVKVGLICLLRKFRVTMNERTQLPLKMSSKNLVSAAEGGIWLNLEKM